MKKQNKANATAGRAALWTFLTGICFVGAVGAADVRYLSNAGDDAADGLSPQTAWRTPEKANRDLPPGATLLLRRGDVFYGSFSPKAGTAARRTTLSAFGEGPKPVVSCLKTVKPSAWEAVSAGYGIWRAEVAGPSNVAGFVTTDVNPGFLLVDGAVKPWRKFSRHDVNQPWDFAGEDGFLYVHATNNPSLLAREIRFSVNVHVIHAPSHFAVSNVAIRGTGAHGVVCGWWPNRITEDVRISDCDFENVGGSELIGYSGAGGKIRVRYGNGVEFGSNVRDAVVARCTFRGVYDTCITMQGYPSLTSWEDVHVRDCTMTDCTQAFELWCAKTPKGMGWRRCSFTGNRTCRVGGGWGALSRPNRQVATPLLLYGIDAEVVDVDVSGNVFEAAPLGILYKSGGLDKMPKGYRIHDNRVVGCRAE